MLLSESIVNMGMVVWERDYLLGRRSRVPIIKMWASDHLFLFGRGVPLSAEVHTHRF